MLSRFSTKKKGAKEKEAYDADPAVEAYKNHILTLLSVNITTLVQNDWISPQTFNLLTDHLLQDGLTIDPNTVAHNTVTRNSVITNPSSYHTAPSPTTPSTFPHHAPSLPQRTEAAPPSYHSSTAAAPPLPSRGPSQPFPAASAPAPKPVVVAPIQAAPPTPIATKPKPTPGPKVGGKPSVIAISDFDAVEPEDLAFRTGDIITILESVDENWYKGELRGKVGIFPKTYVQDR
ncbi:Neutrophil cytosol factor 2 [Rhizophlyctis rosea]|nr:Neutrophil cytosol factor 2 [Rhizophlyctis rosea]